MRVRDWWLGREKKPGSDACNRAVGKSKLLVVAALFALCVGSTFISYQPYLFQWDDSDYFARSVVVSIAFWSGDVPGLTSWIVADRPPAMTLMGIPWGPLRSWNAAGKCFITLAAVIALLAAASLYFLLRIGIRPVPLVVASICVCASIGPYPPGATAHAIATGFMADSLFAWTALAAVLFIPYEARSHSATVRGSIFRGILWGIIFSLGTMTKLSFLYFVVLIVPVLFFMRLYRDGFQSALTALSAFACCSLPSALYLLRWGERAFNLAQASSFGGLASFYYFPLLQFVSGTIRESPGLALSVVFTAFALLYLVIRRQTLKSWPGSLALLIMVGFGIVVLATPNREVRFAFPAIVALPLLAGVLVSGKGHSITRAPAALAAGLVFGCLFAASIPARHRPDWRSLNRCNAVLEVAARSNAKLILLATDSPTLNVQLMTLGSVFSPILTSNKTLAYKAVSGVPIEEDFRMIDEAHLVVFQDRFALSPPFTNQRVSAYERYVRQVGFGPLRVADDTSVYFVRNR